MAIGGEDESRVLAAFDIILKTLDDHPLKQQVHYYDPTKNDGPQGGMGGGGPPPQHDGPGNSQMGGGLGSCLYSIPLPKFPVLPPYWYYPSAITR